MKHCGIILSQINFIFTFAEILKETNSNEVIKLIKNLNVNKACQNTDTPTKITKSNADLFASYIFRNYNYCLEKGEFPCVLKHADVVPVHKKKEKTDKANYRPLSILPNISKIYEKLTYQQLYDHFDSIISPKQYGSRKGHSAQNCLMVPHKV